MGEAKIIPGTTGERKIVGLALALGAFLLLLDQITKILVVSAFGRQGETVPVIDKFFSITYATNTGAAWGMFSGYAWLLLIVGMLVVILAVMFLRPLTEGYTERYFAVFMIIAGVIGNSADRISRGAVVDFLDFYVGSYHWPTFNVADIAICTGTGLFILSSFARDRKKAASSIDAQ
ncbi:MAG: signal peptidase II [Lentisphaeria bacterium]|nr:signal peptidase II [Lentisphaeria bacterium]